MVFWERLPLMTYGKPSFCSIESSLLLPACRRLSFNRYKIDQRAQWRGHEAPRKIESWAFERRPPHRQNGLKRTVLDVRIKPVFEGTDDAMTSTCSGDRGGCGINADDQPARWINRR
jgi:hypothetical protein